MLNLVLVGYGDDQKIMTFAETIQNELQKFTSQYNNKTYDADAIWRAECKPELLKRKNRIKFPTKRTVLREYWGMVEQPDYEELYSILFSPVEDNVGFSSRKIPYSRANLKALMKELAYGSNQEEEKSVYDMKIDYKYDMTNTINTFCIIKWSLDDKKYNIDILDIFQNMISDLDRMFPEVFASAYITNNCVYPIKNLSFFEQFDENALGDKILGVEYSWYMSGRILEKNACFDNVDLINYHIKELSNGIQYICNCNVCEFDHVMNTDALRYFKSAVIPAYRVIDWSLLCKLKEKIFQMPEMVSVHYDRYAPRDPLIIFSTNCTQAQLDIWGKEKAVVLCERYQLAESDLGGMD